VDDERACFRRTAHARRGAREALEGLERRPLLIAVTVLTSMGPEELRAIGVDAGNAEQQVLRLATSDR
jgi:orotidine-5'-phosphate decarboxylase